MQSWHCNMAKFDIKKGVQCVYHSSDQLNHVSFDTGLTCQKSPALVSLNQQPLAHLAELVDALVLGSC